MDTSLKVNLAMYAGEILLISGAETYRVEDTVIRILKHYKFKTVQTIIITTAIFVNITDENDKPITIIKRTNSRDIDLHKIAAVNSISRKICEDKIEPKDALLELEKIHNSVTYSDRTLILSWSISAAGFTYILGNSLVDTFATLIVGLISGFFAIKHCKKLSRVAYPFCVSAFTTVFAILITFIFKNAILDNIIIGGIMPLLPGVAFVNAIRDVLNTDYMCATARILAVLLVSVCIALGVGFALTIFSYLGGVL